jgi:hypothetical protein
VTCWFPGVAVAEQIQLRAVVKAVDLEKVKVGEQVSLTLAQALAISIDKK